MEWLCWLFGALIFITLVGHGIWVVLAMIFRRLASPKASSGSSIVRPPGERASTDAQIRELLDAGLIDVATYRRVISGLDVVRQRRATPPPIPVLPLVTAPLETEPSPALAPLPSVLPQSPQPAPAIAPRRQPAPPAPKPPRPPRRPFSEVFAAFLRESNIRWGELVGGLLIVGCSVALVVSFWAQIAGKPFFQFGIFTSVTAAAFGLGLYAEHRWKLPTTSRGILLIATMLVPLNFLAFGALSHGAESKVIDAGEVAALALFGFLTWQAARILAPYWPRLLTAGVVMLSGSLLVTQHVGHPESLSTSLALGGLPVAAYGAVIGLMLRRASRWKQIRNNAAEAIFLMLGLLTFAVGLAMGALFLRTDSPLRVARELSPLLSLAAVPALATGLLLWRRITDKRLATARTIGTAIAIAGAFLMLGCLALAWPDPRTILPLAAIDFVILTAVAVRYEIPTAHALATPCLAIAYLLGAEVARHHVGWTSSSEEMVRVLTGPTVGAALLPLFVVFAGIAWLLSFAAARLATSSRKSRELLPLPPGEASGIGDCPRAGWGEGKPEKPSDQQREALAIPPHPNPLPGGEGIRRRSATAWAPSWTTAIGIYAWSSVTVALISIALVTLHGFARPGDPQGATWIYLAYSAAALLAARRFRHLAAGWAGAVLLLASFVQFFVTRTAIELPWATALLAYSTVALAGVAARRRDADNSAPVLIPAKWSAAAAGAGAVVTLLASLSLSSAGPVAMRMLWASGLGFAVSALEASEGLFVAGQIGLAFSAILAVLARLNSRPWFAAVADPLLEPWTAQSIGVALSVVALVFSLARRAVPQSWAVSRWLRREWAFDRVLTVSIVATFAMMVTGAFVAGLQVEFSTDAVRPALDAWSVHAAGGGAWLLFGAILVLFAFALRDRLARVAVPAFVTLVTFGCLLWAARWSADGAAASAARWALAAMLLAGSVPTWLRHRFPRTLEPVLDSVRPLLTALLAMPILALTVYPASLTLAGYHPAGPDPAGFFGRIGNATSYLVPLAIVALVFVGNAIRERADGWAFAGSAVCDLTVTLGYALALVIAGQHFTEARVVHLVQLNIATTALFALGWQAVRTAAGATRRSALLRSEASIALFGTGLLLAPAALWMFALPGSGARAIEAISSPLGWAAFFATVGAAVWIRGTTRDRVAPARITGIMIGIGLLAAAAVAGTAGRGWTAYHVLMATAVFTSALNIGAGALISRIRRGASWEGDAPAEPRRSNEPRLGGSLALPDAAPPEPAPRPSSEPLSLQYARHDQTGGGPVISAVYVAGELLQPAVMRWTGIASGLAVLLSVRAMMGDPSRPWWSVATTATISLLWAALACWLMAPRLLYAGGLLLNLAATFWFVDRIAPGSATPFFDLTSANIAVLALGGLAALVLHLNLFTKRSVDAARTTRLPFHRFAAIVSLIGVIATTCILVTGDVIGQRVAASSLLTLAALGSTIALSAAMLWDAEAPFALPEVYVLGLAAVAMGLHGVRLFHQPLQVGGAIAAAAYVLATGIAYACRGWLTGIARSIGMPPVRREGRVDWLAPASIVLTLLAIALAFTTDFTVAAMGPRLGSASAAVVGLGGLMLLVRGSERPDLRQFIFALLRISTVAWGWAWLAPGAAWITRAVVLLSVLGISLLACGLIAAREREGSFWPAAARHAFGSLAFGWAASSLLTIGLEVAPHLIGAPIQVGGWAIAVVLVNLIGGAIAGVMLAVSPRRDPLDLPALARGAYVYAAEALLALGLVHLRVTMPWLFGGILSQYWPLVIMALAFGGVAVGEVFRRRGTIVLSSPLFTTGAFLPLLPVAAFWLAPSRVELWSLLFTIGLFYAILSAGRRSFAFGVLAALAANGGLWSLLARQPALAFLVHPQVWLIPAAASVLIAAQLNRDRLTAGQLRFARYCCLMVVYVSSTADIFLNGVKDHPALPLVLAGLSVAGVMLGILFRVRAFLFLGTSFLALSIVTMIYYASVDLHWTWLWYVAGIALGAAILVTFALFEKKRAEMVALVDGLKRWQ